MRIAVLSCFYPFRGGISQFNANLFSELGKAHEVRAFNFSRQYPSFLFPGRTQYVTADDEASPVESERILDTVCPGSWIKTARRIREFAPDVLVVRYWMPFFAPSLGYVCRHAAQNTRVVSILDNVIPHEKRPFDKALTKYFISGSDGCVTLCSEVGEQLHAIAPGKKSAVLYHPLYSHFGERLPREEAERKLGLPHGGKNLLFFGLIREYKGLDILLEAFRTLDESYNLIIAGEPYGSFEQYRKLIDAIPGNAERIKVFPEYIRDSRVKDFFSAADLTILPYRSATQSGVGSVSYHFEVPMVVTDVGGLKETVGDTGTGLVASSPDPQAVREEIIRYFSSPSIREECVRNIRKEKDRLSWERFCGELLKFADSL